MAATLHFGDRTPHRSESAHADGSALFLPVEELPAASGWELKPEGACLGEVCVPLSAAARGPGFVDVAALARALGRPLVREGETWVAGEPAAARAEALASLEAPDFELPDLAGRHHRLSEHRGRKVLILSWASWWGCREDLPVWQALYEELGPHGFVPIAVALEARGAAAAGEWIRAAAPTYPCLIDERHTVAELYGMVNVPMAVWIDENGVIVRPAEIAGASEAFRTELDRETFDRTERGVAEASRVREAYSAAVRAWVLEGRHALLPEEVRRRLRLPTPTDALAAAHARLGEILWEAGDGEGARRHFAEASRLVPDSWCYRRQAWNLEESPKLADERFWQAIDAVPEGAFYPEPPDLGRVV